MTSLEICAGGGGQAIGLEDAGFKHLAVIEIEHAACETLRLNRPQWNVIEDDIRNFSAKRFKGVDLLAGGVPCPPFSKAGKQLGCSDVRDLFPEAIRLIDECRPRAIMLENVRGLRCRICRLPYKNRSAVKKDGLRVWMAIAQCFRFWGFTVASPRHFCRISRKGAEIILIGQSHLI